LEQQIKNAFDDAEINLEKGDKGIFDIYLGKLLVFSKDASGRFPEDQEIIDLIKQYEK
jgi:selT/selW/selH-like putative selenoprotein